MEEREIWEVLCSRHSTAVQEKLWKAQVAVAGLGGLGSNIAVSLARIGVGGNSAGYQSIFGYSNGLQKSEKRRYSTVICER